MGGAVKAATKPVVKVFQDIGFAPKPEQAKQMLQEAGQSSAASVASTAQRDQAEEIMAKRRARRAGRALLSDARLNPEQGLQSTLGSGPGL